MRVKFRSFLAKTLAIFLATAFILSIASTLEPALAAGCTGSSCYGKDPQQMGCASDQIVADTTALKNSKGEKVGSLELKYSRVCQAYWAKLINNKFWAPMWVSLYYYDQSGNWAPILATRQENDGGTEEYSLMSSYLPTNGCGRLTLTTSGTVSACTPIRYSAP